MRDRFTPDGRFGLRLTLALTSMALLAVPFAFLLVQVLSRGPVSRLDEDAAGGFLRFAADRPLLTDFLTVVSLLGKPLSLGIAAALGAAYALWRRRRRLALYLVVSSIGGGLLNSMVKLLVDRTRPDVEDPLVHASGTSFPSGHAMSSTATYGALLLVSLPALSPRQRVVAFLATAFLVASIGISRVLLGVHFVSDVLAGYILGAAWLSATTAAFSILRLSSDPTGTGTDLASSTDPSPVTSRTVRPARRGSGSALLPGAPPPPEA